ncbi:MAG: M28 family peptidase [Pirellulaceae bacterium]|nr:M28 family peptidase [Pirellulaceae bacterium]
MAALSSTVATQQICWGVEHSVETSDASDIQLRLRADVEFLSSEELRGRDVADDTIHDAANYIAQRMAAAGLQTALIDDKPFQSVTVTLGARAGARQNNQVTFELGSPQTGDPIVAEFNRAMNPLSIGAQAGRATGKVAFVGYGITAEKLDYDDYAGIDAQDAIVMVLRKEPGVSDPDSPFDGVRNTRHAYFATKIENAIAHGAAAVMFINDRASIDEAVKLVKYKISQEKSRGAKIRQQMESLPEAAKNSLNTLKMKLDSVNASIESLTLDQKRAARGILGISEAGGAADTKRKIPVVSIARDLADDLLTPIMGRSVTQIEASINKDFAPQSQYLDGVNCTVSVELKATTANSPNVIGVLPGRGELAQETVLLGAHYDHVGMGGYGSLAPGTIAVHNGADDNASGVATMLAAGERLVRDLRKQPAHRRILFVAFTGEERGLVGSQYYVDHPLHPLETTAAMINLDMVGRLRDNELTVYGTGSAKGLDDIVEASNKSRGFDLFKVPSGYGPSDHQSFYKAGVPVLFFFTGLHNDYHRPSDDFDKIDFGGMTRITDIVSDVTLQLAVRNNRPEYAETENRVQVRRQLTAYLGVNLSDRGDHVVLSGIAPRGPAATSGLEVGDQLTRIGKRSIRTSMDVLDLLRNRSPGENLIIRILRGDKPLDIAVKLGKRPSG